MNILIITGIFPPDIGGPATYVPQIAKGLTDHGNVVTVLTLADSSASSSTSDNRQLATRNPQCISYPFPIIRISRPLFKPWRWLRTVWRIIRAGRKVDVLFVNGLAMESVLANLLLRRPMVQKVVGDLAWERTLLKGWVSDNFETFQTTRYKLRATFYALHIKVLKALRSWWTSKADMVIVASQCMSQWVRTWGVKEQNISVIPNPLGPLEGIEPAVIPLKTGVKIVTVGRLIPLKRIDGIIRAIEKLPEVGLVIVGDGPELPRLRFLATRLGVTDRVHFSGAKSHVETLSFMAACDLFVLNSIHESFSYVVLEAMALGLPVVATAVGAIPELIRNGESGRLISVTPDEALHEALAELISCPQERGRLAAKAREEIGWFQFEPVLNKTELLFKLLIERNRKGKRRLVAMGFPQTVSHLFSSLRSSRLSPADSSARRGQKIRSGDE